MVAHTILHVQATVFATMLLASRLVSGHTIQWIASRVGVALGTQPIPLCSRPSASLAALAPCVNTIWPSITSTAPCTTSRAIDRIVKAMGRGKKTACINAIEILRHSNPDA
jgi:hypothetical protein